MMKEKRSVNKQSGEHSTEVRGSQEWRRTRHSGEDFEILLNRFGSGMKEKEAMINFEEKKRQRNDESIDWFLDELESLRRRSNPEQLTNRRNIRIASKFIVRVKNHDLRTLLATYYTISKDNAPNPEEMGEKSREYILMKPKKFSISDGRNLQGVSQQQRLTWYKPRDDMDKQQSCVNCGSADHYIADCSTKKTRDEKLGIYIIWRWHESDGRTCLQFYSGLIIKIGARWFFCSQEGHFTMDCTLFWEAKKKQKHPKHKIALAAVQNNRNRQAENDLQSKDVISRELSTKFVKAVTEERERERCWRGSNKKFTGDKLPEGGSRGYQQSGTRLGDKGDRTKAE